MILEVSDYYEKKIYKLTNKNALGIAQTATSSALGRNGTPDYR
jgi:hypothetical protein